MNRLNPKSSALLASLLALLLVATPLLYADGDLEHPMEAMEKIYKTLKKQVKDETKRDANLKLIADFQKQVLIANGLLPEGVSRLSGDEKEKAVTSYRTMMLNLLRSALDLEEALVNKKYDDAEKEIATLLEIEKSGHKEFRKEH